MAKKQTAEAVAENVGKAKKKSGAGAVFGSILFFLLTFLTAVLFLCSAVAYTTLQQGSLSKAVSKMDLSQAELTEDGKTQKLGNWVYEWYMLDAPNLSPEYAEAALARPEMNELICHKIDDYADYLTKKTETLPELDANEVADLLQDDVSAALLKQTGVKFAEKDRSAMLWSAEDDIAGFNADMQESVGRGFGKFAIRYLCTLPGVVTCGILTGVFFILWLIFAIKGHWRKGRMLTGFGCAVAIPNLLVLAGSGVMLLLTCAMNVLPSLAFTADGLPTLLLPVVWSSLALALCGMIFASIGICTNAVVKAKRKKAVAAATATVPTVEMGADSVPSEAPIPAPEPVTVPETPTVSAESTEPQFTYKEMQEPQTDTPVAEIPAGICPHCGAQNEPDSKFCGSCGGSI